MNLLQSLYKRKLSGRFFPIYIVNRELTILIFLVIVPIVLAGAYDHYFDSSQGWMEEYQFHFILSFFVIALVSSIWLAWISKKNVA